MVSTHLWLTRTIATLMLVAVAGTAYASNPAYGIVTQAFDRSMEMRTVQSGAGSVRLDLDWDRLETADNYYEPNYVNEILSNLARAEAHGLHVYLTIAYTPGWANGNQPHQYPPTDYNKWQEVLQDIFFVLGDRPNLTFGIWNEPDLPQFLVDDSAATNWKQLWYRAHVARFNVGKPYIKLGGPDHTGYGPRLGYFSTGRRLDDGPRSTAGCHNGALVHGPPQFTPKPDLDRYDGIEPQASVAD